MVDLAAALRLAVVGPSARRHVSNIRPSAPFKVLFLGRDEFSCLVLRQLCAAQDVYDTIHVSTYPDGKKQGRHGQPGIAPLKHVAHDLKLPVTFIPRTKSEFKTWEIPDPFRKRAEEEPDPAHVMLTASFGRLIHDPVLHAFLPCRRLNVHPSLLPAFRGPAPIQHAIMHGGSVFGDAGPSGRGDGGTGVSIVEMKERRFGADVGVIWGREEIPLPDDADYLPVRDHLARLGGDLLVTVLRKMLAGTAVSTAQDPSLPPSRAGLVTAKMAEVDFQTMNAHRLVRLHRAIGHQRPLVVHTPNRRSVQLFAPAVYVPSPGQPSLEALLDTLPAPGDAWYCPATQTALMRCAGGTILSVRELQLQGKARVRARDWWQGVRGLGHVRRVGSTFVTRLGNVAQ